MLQTSPATTPAKERNDHHEPRDEMGRPANGRSNTAGPHLESLFQLSQLLHSATSLPRLFNVVSEASSPARSTLIQVGRA